MKRAIEESVISRRPKFNRKALEQLAEKFADMFETIIKYEEVSFPDVMVEMKNPFAVSVHLRSIFVERNGEEEPFYTESQIEDILTRNFGEGWKEEYLKKYVGQAIPPEKPK